MDSPSFKDLNKDCENFAQKLRDETDPLGYGPDSDDTLIDAATQQFRSVAIETDKLARVRALALARRHTSRSAAAICEDILSIVGLFPRARRTISEIMKEGADHPNRTPRAEWESSARDSPKFARDEEVLVIGGSATGSVGRVHWSTEFHYDSPTNPLDRWGYEVSFASGPSSGQQLTIPETWLSKVGPD